MKEPIRIILTPEQSAQLQAAGENAFTVALRRGYEPGNAASIGQWQIYATPADNRRLVGAMQVVFGSHEPKRIKSPRKP
jgi:hypothetical protein